MSAAQHAGLVAYTNKRAVPLILVLALSSVSIYAILAGAGDLRGSLPSYLAAHAALSLLMLLAWRVLVKAGRGGGLILACALLFRLVAALGEPSLSDDVYRYVWDGRVQLHGVQPYRFAPADPELAGLRDENWGAINHPELRTIYPPLAEAFFLLVAATGAGPVGFRLALGLVDFGVVLLLGTLLRRLSLPGDRIVLYAWNPLAVMEVAGSGHVEPLGVVAVLLAIVWILERRDKLSTMALAAAVHAKLLPFVLIPAFWRRYGRLSRALFVGLVVLGFVPFALVGPAVGSGLFDYAERWEYNAFVYAGIEGSLEALDTGHVLKPWVETLQRFAGESPIPWEFVYNHIWPRDLARLCVLFLACGWALYLALRGGRDLAREVQLVLGGVLLLSPIVHPWYLLWLLPLAALRLSWGWLLWGCTVPLAYLGSGSDVPWSIRWIEYLPPLSLMLWCGLRSRGRG